MAKMLSSITGRQNNSLSLKSFLVGIKPPSNQGGNKPGGLSALAMMLKTAALRNKKGDKDDSRKT